MACLTTDEFYRYLGGELSADDVDRVRLHLNACADCSARLARFENEHDGVLGHLRVAVEEVARPSDDAGVTVSVQPLSTGPAGDDSLIPGYSILKELHRGGQGIVYQAVQTSTKRKVAVKLLLEGHFASKAARRRFEREVELVASLKHPHIVAIFDSGQTRDGRQYFVMDYVRGTPLTQYARDHKLGINETLTLYAKVCDAIQYAHQRGVIHRDLKPGNILVDESGEPRVLDFGLAKQIGGAADTLLSLTGQIVGTLAYMSPEQARGNPDEIDTRTDLYALGVILYEMLTGSTPYPAAAAMAEVVRSILDNEPARPSVHNRALGDELDTIVLKLLSKERDRRYASAAALASDVRRYLAGEPIEAKSDSGWYVLKKNLRRYRGVIGTATAFVVVLVGATIASTTLYFRAEEQKELAVASARAERVARDDAEAARTEALDNLKLADHRAAELKQVADFQASMLSDVDVEQTGRTIIRELRDQVRDGLERTWVAGDDGKMRKRTVDEIDAVVAQFDVAAAPANPTDVARQMIDHSVLTPAVETIAEEFQDQPEVRAKLLETVGRVYRSIGEYDRAEACLRQALELHRQVHGDEHADVAAARRNLALCLRDQGDPDAAESLLRDTLALQRRMLGDAHPDVARTLNELAWTLHRNGDHTAAEPLYQEALSIRQSHYDDEHPDVATSVSNLGSLLHAKGDYAGAERLFRQALEIRRKVYGEESEGVAQCLGTLATLLEAKGDYAAAEPVYRETLARYRKLFGDEHPYVAASLNNLASVLIARGELAAAEPFARQSLSLTRSLLGDDHPNVSYALNTLAGLLYRRGNLAEAQELVRESLNIRRTRLGDDHIDVAGAKNNLAFLLRRAGKHDEAEPLYRESLASLQRLLGDDHPDVAQIKENLGALLQSRGDLAAAEPLLREALAVRRTALGDEHPAVAQGLNNLAFLLYEKGDLSEAESLLRESLAIRRQKLGADHPDTLVTAHNLGRVLRGLDRLDEAESLGAEAVQGLAEKLPMSAPPRSGAVVSHAETLVAMQRFGDAEKALIAAYQDVEGQPEAARTRQEFIAAIAQLYDAWHEAEPGIGHDRKADEWRARLASYGPPSTPTTQPAMAPVESSAR